MNIPIPDDDFLQSLRRSPRAEAPPFLFTRIGARLRAGVTRLDTVPPRKLALVSVAAALLVLLNVAAWQQLSSRAPATPGIEGLGISALDVYSSPS